MIDPTMTVNKLKIGLAIAALMALIPPEASARHAERSVVVHRTVSAWAPPDGLVLVGFDLAPVTVDIADDEFQHEVSATTTRLLLEGGVLGLIRVHGSLPYHAWSGADPAWGLPAAGSGLGDLNAGVVVGPWSHDGWFALALDARRSWATGDQAKGLGAGESTSYLGTALTLRFWPDDAVPELRLHLNVGVAKRPARGFGDYGPGSFSAWGEPWPTVPEGGDDADNDARVVGAALEFRKNDVSLAVEYAHHDYPDVVATSGEEPAWWSAAVHWGGETGPGLTLAYDVPVSLDDPATPFRPLMADHTVRLGVGWSFAVGGRDRDGDGLKDRVDPCPDDAEDFDGFRDDDGCPDPDNDEDGIPDIVDLAPNLPEDFDGWNDLDGLPEPDNDLDGILDQDDDCPDEAEDFDGHQDDDGCPEEFLDADGDGIPDEDDLCPLEAEDRDGYRDDDGCPDLDNDLDGIPDAIDACPDLPEDYDGVDDEDGCPE